LLFRLRAHLDEGLHGASIERAARELGLSTRSLQRRLRESGATFKSELDAARIRRAERLLSEPEAKITAVAHEVGCASSQSFSALFKRLTGETPSEWRASRASAR